MADSKAVSAASKPSMLDSAQILNASKALLNHLKESAKEQEGKSGKRNLLDEKTGSESDDDDVVASVAETPIWLTLTTKRHILDSRRLQPNKIVVPHPLNTDNDTTVCLITADPQRAYKNLIAAAEFPADLRKRITRVIDIAHLQKKFKSYEAQRKLFAEHDLFLGDDRIISRLPKALGKTFYKTTVKRPIPVTLVKARPRGPDGKRVKAPKKKTMSAANISGDSDALREEAIVEAVANARSPAQMAAEIQRAMSAVVVSLLPSTNTAVRIGSGGWPAAHIAANVEVVAQALVDKFVPQRWNNVRGFFIKGPRTMAMPIWETSELWVDGAKDVLKAGSEELKALEAKREKANIGKKRKAITEEVPTETGKASKAEKTGKDSRAKKAKLPESNDDSLNKSISERKARLRKQKSAAKKAIEV